MWIGENGRRRQDERYRKTMGRSHSSPSTCGRRHREALSENGGGKVAHDGVRVVGEGASWKGRRCTYLPAVRSYTGQGFRSPIGASPLSPPSAGKFPRRRDREYGSITPVTPPKQKKSPCRPGACRRTFARVMRLLHDPTSEGASPGTRGCLSPRLPAPFAPRAMGPCGWLRHLASKSHGAQER